jgi:hypothetical protein
VVQVFEPQQPQPTKTNSLATTSLVTGILSLLCFPPLGLVAVIVGPMAISQLNKQKSEGRPEETGRGMAIAGTVLGIVSLTLFVGFLLLTVAGTFD